MANKDLIIINDGGGSSSSLGLDPVLPEILSDSVIHSSIDNQDVAKVYYTVTFDTSGVAVFNDDNTTTIKVFKVESGKRVSKVPGITLNTSFTGDYILNGWRCTSSSDIKVNSAITEDVIFVPNLITKTIETRAAITWTVSFQITDVQVDSIVVIDGESVNQACERIGKNNLKSELYDAMNYEVDGYYFTGWSVNPNDTIVKYFEFDKPIYSDLLLKPVYKKKPVPSTPSTPTPGYQETDDYKELLEFLDQLEKEREESKDFVLDYIETEIERDNENNNDITLSGVVGIVVDDSSFNTENIFSMNPISAEDIGYHSQESYLVDFFGLKNYVFDDSEKTYTTRRVIENGQMPGTYIVEETVYKMTNDFSGLDGNSYTMLEDIIRDFEDNKRVFHEGFYNHRGSLVNSGTYKKRSDDAFNELLTTYVNNTEDSFLTINSLKGSNAYHKMNIFSDGMYKMLTMSSSLLEDNKKQSTCDLSIRDLEFSIILEEKNNDSTIHLYNLKEGISGDSVLKDDRNVFQRIVQHELYPTEYSFREDLIKKNRINFLNEISTHQEEGDNNNLQYYIDEKGELIFGFDTRPHHKYQILLDDVAPLVSDLLSNYFITGSINTDNRQVYIKDWHDNYQGKMSQMLDKIEFKDRYPKLTNKLKYTTGYGDGNKDVGYRVSNDVEVLSKNSIFLNLIKKSETKWGVK